MIVYVDDIIIAGDDLIERDMLRKRLAVEFEIKKTREAKIFSWHRGGTFKKRNFYLPTEIYS